MVSCLFCIQLRPSIKTEDLGGGEPTYRGKGDFETEKRGGASVLP